ncbi:hypothetical protein L2E82_33928 [Cichorium intybus]|uniref:Uncharacterized protein n=1 Tax=Cichorium intybus TaxID=13427 RepID=A0ACB9BLC5_CICIN|nr:hypothetical protein L2E82_33928 [Cichorium intybus]
MPAITVKPNTYLLLKYVISLSTPASITPELPGSKSIVIFSLNNPNPVADLVNRNSTNKHGRLQSRHSTNEHSRGGQKALELEERHRIGKQRWRFRRRSERPGKTPAPEHRQKLCGTSELLRGWLISLEQFRQALR